MKTKQSLFIVSVMSSVLLLTACQTTPNAPVIQRENKVFETTGLGKTKVIAKQNAVNSANAQCGRLSTPIVVKDSMQYNGVLDENLGKVVDKATTVIGGILGKSTSIARDDDYEYTMSFKCQ